MSKKTVYTPKFTRNMSDAELKKEVKRLSGIANRRIERAEERGGFVKAAPAYRVFFREDKPERRFSADLNNRYELVQEYRRLHTFLDDDTSTVTGARQWESRMKKLTHVNFSDPDEAKEYWETFDNWQKANVQNAYDSNQLKDAYSVLYKAGKPNAWQYVQDKASEEVSKGNRPDLDDLVEEALKKAEEDENTAESEAETSKTTGGIILGRSGMTIKNIEGNYNQPRFDIRPQRDRTPSSIGRTIPRINTKAQRYSVYSTTKQRNIMAQRAAKNRQQYRRQ